MINRIGAIRDVISSLGGEPFDLVYYADGPSSTGFGVKYGTVYKIENYSDGLTPELREKAVELLAKIPGVERSWITRKHKRAYFTHSRGIKSYGGHIKVHFTKQSGR